MRARTTASSKYFLIISKCIHPELNTVHALTARDVVPSMGLGQEKKKLDQSQPSSISTRKNTASDSMAPGVGDLLEGPVRDRLIMFLFAFDTLGQLLILFSGNVGPILRGRLEAG